jgi:uncharacterized protein (TIGR03435 family)
MKYRTVTLVILVAAITAFPLQSQILPVKKPSFGAASIKPNSSGGRTSISGIGGRMVATNYTLRMLIVFAYADRPMMESQIGGGPNWMATDRFDVEAKIDDGSPLPPAEMKLRVQALLEERFQLKLHRETRELPIYNVVISKGGHKVQLSKDQSPPDPRANTSEPPRRSNDPNYVPPLPRGRFGMMNTPTGMVLTGTAIPISTFVNLVQGQVDRPVVDKTNLKGLFDIRLKFTPLPVSAAATSLTTQGVPAGAEPNGPSIFTALQEQLGLRLEAARGPTEVLVIDHAEKPSAN